MNGKFALFIFLSITALAPALPAGATGTATIVQPDGTKRTYSNVRIAIWNATLALTSSDGQGTVVVGKASCLKVNELIKCLPWDATLFQNGDKLHIAVASGTVWLNPTTTRQQFSHSTTSIPPHGVVMDLHTKRGTYVSLSGVIDEVNR